MKNNNDFKWISQQLCDITDITRNTKCILYFEAGSTKDLDSNNISYIPSRLSVKIRDFNINNTKVEIEFSYFECFELLRILNAAIKQNNQKSELKSYNKNKLRKFIITPININNIIEYVISVFDETSLNQTISVQIDYNKLLALKNIIMCLVQNWITNTQNIYTVISQQQIISSIDMIRDMYNNISIKQLHISTPTNNNVISEPIQSLNEIVEKNDTPINTITEDESTESDEEYNNEEIEVSFDSFNNSTDNSSNKSNVISNQLSNLLSDENLSKVELDGKIYDYTSNKKITNTLRPFLNNFLNWDMETLYTWINGIILLDSKSDDITLTPIDLFFSKSFNKSKQNVHDIVNHKDFYKLNYYVISNIKQFANNYLQQKSELSTYIYELKDIYKIKRNDNKVLWDFIIDIFGLFLVLRLYIHIIDLLQNKNNENSCNMDVRFSCEFLFTFAISLFQLLDEDDYNEFGKNELSQIFSEMINHDMIVNLNNCFSEFTMGGSLSMNLDKLNNFSDKYIDIIKNKITVKDFSEFEYNINSINDIREQLKLKIQTPIKKDIRTLVFINYIKEMNYETELEYDDTLKLSELPIDSEKNKDIILAYNTIVTSSTLNNLFKKPEDNNLYFKELRKEINLIHEYENENQSKNEKTNEIIEIKNGMWDISDDESELEHIFN